jgi:hypothetical protein
MWIWWWRGKSFLFHELFNALSWLKAYVRDLIKNLLINNNAKVFHIIIVMKSCVCVFVIHGRKACRKLMSTCVSFDQKSFNSANKSHALTLLTSKRFSQKRENENCVSHMIHKYRFCDINFWETDNKDFSLAVYGFLLYYYCVTRFKHFLVLYYVQHRSTCTMRMCTNVVCMSKVIRDSPEGLFVNKFFFIFWMMNASKHASMRRRKKII